MPDTNVTETIETETDLVIVRTPVVVKTTELNAAINEIAGILDEVAVDVEKFDSNEFPSALQLNKATTEARSIVLEASRKLHEVYQAILERKKDLLPGVSQVRAAVTKERLIAQYNELESKIAALS